MLRMGIETIICLSPNFLYVLYVYETKTNWFSKPRPTPWCTVKPLIENKVTWLVLTNHSPISRSAQPSRLHPVSFNNASAIMAITAPILCISAERRGVRRLTALCAGRCTILGPLFPSFLYSNILFSICHNYLYHIDSLYMCIVLKCQGP